MEFRLHAERFAVCRLDPSAGIPDWATSGEIFSVSRTAEELSIVVAERFLPDPDPELQPPGEPLPPPVQHEPGWRCLALRGPIPFNVTGVAARFTSALAASNVSVFVVSTYDTDLLFVKDAQLTKAMDALKREGYAISR